MLRPSVSLNRPLLHRTSGSSRELSTFHLVQPPTPPARHHLSTTSPCSSSNACSTAFLSCTIPFCLRASWMLRYKCHSIESISASACAARFLDGTCRMSRQKKISPLGSPHTTCLRRHERPRFAILAHQATLAYIYTTHAHTEPHHRRAIDPLFLEYLLTVHPFAFRNCACY